MLKRIFLAAAVALVAAPSYATVDVAFVNPEKFSDSANQRYEMQGTLDALRST
jgi:Skp family chaperone for outer membrane proteins